MQIKVSEAALRAPSNRCLRHRPTVRPFSLRSVRALLLDHYRGYYCYYCMICMFLYSLL